MAWKNDYKNSRQIEVEVERRLQQKNFITENSSTKGLFPCWDISVTSATTSKVYTVEVKYQTSPEVYIESGRYTNKGFEKTGILISEATHHCFAFPDTPNYFMIQTSTLLQLVKQYPKQKTDLNNYILHILPQNLVIQHSKIF